jgi:uncharacterized YccA/Bax inhibitor family protein
MRSGNPVLTDNVFASAPDQSPASVNTMTLNGTIGKTACLTAILATTAMISWNLSWQHVTQPSSLPGWLLGSLIGSSIGAMVVAIVTSFFPKWSPVTAPIYAACEGMVLGFVSAVFEKAYEGIVLQAFTVTVGVLIVMLLAYATRIVRVSQKLRTGILVATGGIAMVYLSTFLLGLFGVTVPYIHEAGPVGILFSLVVSGVAAFNLILDFDFIAQGTQGGAPKYMEWYAGFGLLVTVVWLYLEILNLLAKLRSFFGSSR